MDILKNENIKILNENNKVVIFNKKNFCWVRMNELIYKKYINKKSNSENILIESLKKYNVLDNKDLDNQNMMNTQSLYFTLTRKCNMSCEFCSMKSNPNINIDDELNMDEIKNIIPILKKINPRKIILTGGEPTIRKDFVELINLFNEAFGSDKLILQSNGLLLNPELIKMLSSKLLRVDISIESIFENDKLYDFFNKVFEDLKKESIDIRFSFVISPDNKKYLNEAVDLAVKYNSNIDIRLVSPVGYAIEKDASYLNEVEIMFFYKELIELIIDKGYINKGIFDLKDIPLQPKIACGANGRILSIYPDGNLYMCHSLFNEKFGLGNIKDSSYESIKHNMNIKLNDKNIKDLLIVDNISPCKDCDIKYFCGGICAATRISCDDIDRLTISCNMNKLLIKFNLFYYDKNLSSSDNLKELLKHINKYIEENYLKQNILTN